MVLFLASPFVVGVHSQLLHSVQTGQPAVEHVHGKPAFECFSSVPDVAFAFNEAMTVISAALAPAVLDAYSFEGIGTLLDVAGGHGYFICEVLNRYPQMKGMLLDLPSVVDGAKCAICERRMDHRCEPIAGNFFEHIPAGADAYFMQHIIHDWDDEHCIRILANCRKAMKPGGKVLVAEQVLLPGKHMSISKLLDLQLMVVLSGRERYEAQFRQLFEAAGLRLARIWPTHSPYSILEGVAE